MSMENFEKILPAVIGAFLCLASIRLILRKDITQMRWAYRRFSRVAEEDKPALSVMYGIGGLIIGIGAILCTVLWLLDDLTIGILICIICMAIGFVIHAVGEYKYNR